MSSRLGKTLDILVVLFIVLFGYHMVVTLAFFKFLAEYMVPWGLSRAIEMGILIYLLLFQQNTQLKYRFIWTLMAFPTLIIIKFIMDHGWIVGAEYLLGKLPVVGEYIQKVEFVINLVAIVPCAGSVLIDIAFVLAAGHVSGRIPVTNMKSSWYETMTIMGRWLPWNKD